MRVYIMMYNLIKFEDGIYYICCETRVNYKDNQCSVKYKDGVRYSGQVVARHGKYDAKKYVIIKYFKSFF